MKQVKYGNVPGDAFAKAFLKFFVRLVGNYEEHLSLPPGKTERLEFTPDTFLASRPKSSFVCVGAVLSGFSRVHVCVCVCVCVCVGIPLRPL